MARYDILGKNAEKKEGQKMDIRESTVRTAEAIRLWTAIWEESVRASHHFLGEEEIIGLRGYAAQALQDIPHLAAAYTKEGDTAGYIGIAGERIELLFIKPAYFRQRVGTALVEYARETFAVKEVCVNEQNPQAAAFYRAMGFHVYKRTDTDELGLPYPLLYMSCRGDEEN